MNVLLASCSLDDKTRDFSQHPDVHYPLGLSGIHSYLESVGHTVNTFQMMNYPPEQCIKQIEDFISVFDVVGFHVLSANRVCTYNAIEKFSGRAKIVIGGPHATVMYEQIIRKYNNVIAVIGEGELTLAEILTGAPLEEIQGVAFWNGETVIRTADRPLVEDLDTLPFPKHDEFMHPHRITASVMTSRGCPHKCSFCSIGVITKRKVRFRSPENVVEEIVQIKARFPQIIRVWIHDDTFLQDNARAIKICDLLEKKNLGLTFIASARFTPITKEVVLALERAKFVMVLFGLESGSQRVLDRCHKVLKKEDAVKAFEYFKGTKIAVIAFLIIGLPGEDFRSIEETVKFVNKLQSIKYAHYQDIIVLTVYPGTEIYDLYKASGKITDDYWMTDGPVPLYDAEHDVDTLNMFMDSVLDRIAYGRIVKKLDGWQAAS